ncbi:MAG: nucleoside-diphosphate kinase [Lentimicrobiaceae bacterium]|nr:nucleoside-diphosphate kinase [Lentimicrobiaceae bacterium]
MTGKLTFTMIKPSAVEAGHSGKILDMIITAGFHIRGIKKVKLSTAQAGKFYEVHKERPFYQSLVAYMTSGPVYAMVLEKEDAVNTFRKLIGATNPAEAEEGTIRKKFGLSLEKNAVHGSDSDENAIIESHFFFSELEMN